MIRLGWRWDEWYCQPWAWLWSDLERDRLGRWLGPWMLLTWVGPGVVVGHVIGFVLAGLSGGLIPVAVHRLAMRRAQRQHWQTVFWEPTSWAVRRTTERIVWGDPHHWANVPHYERHTPERRWPSPDAYRTARQDEWARLVMAASDTPTRIVIAHTFSTVRGVPEYWRRCGTPFRALARREAQTLPRVQRRMFGTVVPRKGAWVADSRTWIVVTIPVDAHFRLAHNTEPEVQDSHVLD